MQAVLLALLFILEAWHFHGMFVRFQLTKQLLEARQNEIKTWIALGEFLKSEAEFYSQTCQPELAHQTILSLGQVIKIAEEKIASGLKGI